MKYIEKECNQLRDEFKSESDLKFIMKTCPDGEKQIKVQLDNKNILFIFDLIWDIVLFFKQPFNGSDIQPYIFQPIFNNYAPMYIEIALSNICIILPGSLSKKENQSLALVVDLMY